jgi:hypothetical protein
MMMNRDRWTLALFCIASPFVYAYTTGFWRSLKMSALKGAVSESIPLSNLLGWAVEIVGAGIAALIVAAPVAWLLRGRPVFLASCLAMAAAVTLLPDIVIGARVAYFKFILLQLPTLLVFFFLCWGVAILIDKVRQPR